MLHNPFRRFHTALIPIDTSGTLDLTKYLNEPVDNPVPDKFNWINMGRLVDSNDVLQSQLKILRSIDSHTYKISAKNNDVTITILEFDLDSKTVEIKTVEDYRNLKLVLEVILITGDRIPSSKYMLATQHNRIL